MTSSEDVENFLKKTQESIESQARHVDKRLKRVEQRLKGDVDARDVPPEVSAKQGATSEDPTSKQPTSSQSPPVVSSPSVQTPTRADRPVRDPTSSDKRPSDQHHVALPIGSSTPSGSKQLYLTTSDNGSRFVRGKDQLPRQVSFKDALTNGISRESTRRPEPVRTGQTIETIVGNRCTEQNSAVSNSGASSATELEEFIQHVRKKTKRFYLGRFKPGIKPEIIKSYIQGNGGPVVDKINVFKPKVGDDLILQVVVEIDNCSILTDPDFWPVSITCRPWYSKNSYFNKHARYNNREETRDFPGDRAREHYH